MPPDRPDNARTSAGSADCRHGRGQRRSCRPRSSLGLASDPWRPNLAVVDAPRAGARRRRRRPCRGHRRPSPGVSRGIGPDKQHPAVAKPDMRHLHGCGRAVDHHNLVAPVELVGLARIEDQRHIGSGRCLLFLLGPRGRISPDRVIATVISSGPKFLEDPDAGQSFALSASAHLPPASLSSFLLPWTDLRLRLDGALVGMLGRTGSDHLAHRVPRDPQLPADLLDRLFVLKIRPPDLRNRLHNQHPTLCSPMISGGIIHISVRGSFLDADHPATGSILHACSQGCTFTIGRGALVSSGPFKKR